jgi:hypothetical protein
MSNIRERGGLADGSALVVSVTPLELSGFAHSAFLTKREMHEDEMEELVVGLATVRNEFQRSAAPRDLPSFS